MSTRSDDLLEFILAVDQAKRAHSVPVAPTSLIFEVMLGLGYRKAGCVEQEPEDSALRMKWLRKPRSILRATYRDGAEAAVAALRKAGYGFTIDAVQSEAVREGLKVNKSALFKRLSREGRLHKSNDGKLRKELKCGQRSRSY